MEIVVSVSHWTRLRELVMEDRLRREVLTFARELAEKECQRLKAAGTLVEIEELTAEIGDEVARQLAGMMLQRRSDSISEQLAHECPDCGSACPIEPDAEPIILQAIRGDIEYSEPRCFCPRCRRDFFPSGRPDRTLTARNGLAKSS